MIKRKIPKTVAPAEALKEFSFTATHGIDVTTAPTIRDCVYDSTNLDLCSDGGMSLRKPLVFSKDLKRALDSLNYAYEIILADYIFNDEYIVIIIKNLNTNHLEMFYAYEYEGEFELEIFQIFDNSKNLIAESTDDVFIGDNVSILNTANSTIITGIEVHLGLFANGKFIDTTTYKMYHHRYFKILDGDNGLEMFYIEPDIPSIESSETISINYNTIANYVYSLRDNYNSQVISVSGILPYVPTTVVYPENVTVRNLTESDKFSTFSTLESGNTYDRYALKAFLNIKENLNEESKYCCTWEKSYDGITWQEVPEFLDAFNTFDLKIKDTSKISEDLEGSADYTRTVKHTFLKSVNSIEDYVRTRPDILILEKLDSATYRFTIRILYDTTLITFTDPVVSKKDVLISNTDGESFDWSVKFKINSTLPIELDDILFETSFNTTYQTKYPDYPTGISELSPEVSKSVSSEKGSEYLTITLNFKNIKLLNNFQMQGIYFDYCLKYKNLIKYKSSDKIAVANKIPTQFSSLTLDTKYWLKSQVEEFNILNSTDVDILIRGDRGEEGPFEYHELYSMIYNYYRDHLLESNLSTVFKFNVQAIDYTITWTADTTALFFERYRKLYPNYIIKHPSNTNYYVITGNIRIYLAGRLIHTFKSGQLIKGVSSTSNDTVITFNMNDYSIYNYDFQDVYTPMSCILAWVQENKNGNLDLDNCLQFIRVPVDLVNSKEWFLEFMCLKNTSQYTGSEVPYFEYDISTSRLTNDLVLFDGVRVLNNTYKTISNFITEDSDNKFLNATNYSIGLSNWTFLKSNTTEILDTKIPNTVSGKKLYYNHRIYTYGKDYKNCIYATDVDSFTTPLFNMIDLNTFSDTYVTTLIPWRNYLIAATENSIFLIQETSSGFTSKLINTYVGIPEKDSKTCKAILNGLVFKSGKCVYSLQPSAYSSDDAILNIVEISKPVANYVLDGNYQNFAIVTEQAYYLMIPGKETLCLKYEFSRKVWTKYVYPIHITKAYVKSIDNIFVYSDDFQEFTFEKDFQTTEKYGDYLSFITNDDGETVPEVTPIQFMLNSGQKTDDLSRTKQFVESKLILATLDDKDLFPMSVDILIDGLEYKQLHFDAATDSAFIRENVDDILTFNTNVGTNSQNIFNVLRQMFIRYSGKGKSIKHIIYGESVFNFKFYVLYYRYKNTHSKQ